MIKIEQLTIHYHQTCALKELSLAINEHESVAVIGPSGCGKSTLLLAIAGLIKPSQGHISINQAQVCKPRASTGVILQEYGLMPWKTVQQNVALGLQIRHCPKQQIKQQVQAILEQLHIAEYADRYPIQLSGGQQQRVAIARALAIEPDLLLMDEPFSALDTIVREELQQVVLGLYRVRRMAMLIVTHNIEEAVFLGKRIIIMQPNPGRIKTVIDNPYFGSEDLRSQLAYHEMCMKLRSELERVEHD
ncbi:ABC transporter ATP-binding protein [Amphibacillus sediminis]|uniref:ABC transporter ATP-binding protein n=1 Tax=Amphibacillus sediminis TaxID=360185 RepID=UPI001C3F4D50|nr:ABC transporter ATP-binding protein [Amphibacillus sediminis]